MNAVKEEERYWAFVAMGKVQNAINNRRSGLSRELGVHFTKENNQATVTINTNRMRRLLSGDLQQE